mmetsp:Transcript_7662/g.12881  ORF Transcript_7662/g.12881 Transcript_7662/m.12881 type:complete len:94 (-) Transcript_7662:61-342(-)
MFPAAAAQIFGLEFGGQIYTIMFFANSLSSIASTLIVILGKDKIGYNTLFLVGSTFTFFNLVLLYFFDDTKMKKQKQMKAEGVPKEALLQDFM